MRSEGIVLSSDQARAVDAFYAWYEPLREQLQDERDVRMQWAPTPPRFTIGGLAGTGKSTIVGRLMDELVRVRVAAFTGKAAYVLRTKGVSGAQTIHSMIYGIQMVCSSCGRGKDQCKASIDAARESNYRRTMRGKDAIPLSLQQRTCLSAKARREFVLMDDVDADLIVIDEASMVSHDLLADLQTFGIPLLFVGDHGQLEPIGRNPNLMQAPDVRLEQIHRQAAGNPIIQFAHRVRQGYIPQTVSDEARVVCTRGVPSDASEYDVVLCGYNKTRKLVNSKIRRDRGHTGELPESGERVVCLRNDRKFGIFNGMQATVLEVWEDVDEGLQMKVVDDLGKVSEPMPFHPDQFHAESTLQDASRRRTLWDFGYCLTTHKAQGSEWDRVLVLEQLAPTWAPERWRYTAATRAAKHLTYCTRR